MSEIAEHVGSDDGNLARGKEAQQSTVWMSWSTPDKAVDGNTTDIDYSSTLTSQNQWWRVDLGSSYYVYKVVLYNTNRYGK